MPARTRIALLVERRRGAAAADALVDRDQERRADDAVAGEREPPAPVGLGQHVADADVRRTGEEQRVASRGERAAVDPEHLPALVGQRARDRAAVERERVARAAEAAAAGLERDAVAPQQARARHVGVIELVEQLAATRASDCTAGSSTKTMRSCARRLRAGRDHVAPGGAWREHERAAAGGATCALARQGANARMTSTSRPATMRASSSSVGHALARARDEHERERCGRSALMRAPPAWARSMPRSGSSAPPALRADRSRAARRSGRVRSQLFERDERVELAEEPVALVLGRVESACSASSCAPSARCRSAPRRARPA